MLLKRRTSNKMEKEQKEKMQRPNHWQNVNWIKNAFATGLFLFVLLSIGFFGNKATSSSKFCASCHEMGPETYTWHASSHGDVECVDCHTGVSVKDMLEAKGNVFARTIKKLSKTYVPPIQMPKEINNSSCQKCHDMDKRVVSPTGDLVIPHAKHNEKGVKCVSCHSGVAHGKIAERNVTFSSDYDKWDKKMGVRYMSDLKYTRPPMEKCMTCHTARKVTLECLACHTTGMLPENHKNKTEFVNNVHGPEAYKKLEECNECHKWMSENKITLFDKKPAHIEYLSDDSTDKEIKAFEYIKENTFCRDCHATKPASHVKGFIAKHPGPAKQNRQKCFVCHDNVKTGTNPITQTACGTCHPSSHSNYKLSTQHPRTTTPPTKIVEYCYTCHARNTCENCHLDGL